MRHAGRPMPVQPPARILGRQIVHWLVRTRTEHARLCQLAGITRDDLTKLIAGRKICGAAAERVRRVLIAEEAV